MKKVLLITLFAFFSLFGKIYASETSGEETTTISFADVTAIHSLTDEHSVTHFIVGDFILSFKPSAETATSGNLLFRKQLGDGTDVNSILFFLGKYEKNRIYKGDAITIVNRKGHIIKKIEAMVFQHSNLSPYFFTNGTGPNDYSHNNVLVCYDNSPMVSWLSSAPCFVEAGSRSFVYLQGLTITTEGPDAVGCETADKGEFEINLQNITFEESEELRSAYMNFDLVARNDEMVERYRIIVTNPENEKVIYCNELISRQSAEASPLRAADQNVSRTISGRVHLTKLNFSGETPVMISIRPELAAHIHDSQPTVYTQKTTGAEDIELAPDAATAEYFDVNGTHISRPIPGKPYILRRGAKVSKVISK